MNAGAAHALATLACAAFAAAGYFAFPDATEKWEVTHTALAGGAYGLLISLAFDRGSAGRDAMIRALSFANPLILISLASQQGALATIASFLLWRSVFALAAKADHREPPSLALALLAAPMTAPVTLYFYPLLIPALAVLSPWPKDARRLAGYYFVLLAPIAMALAASAYCIWIFSIPPPAWPAPAITRPESFSAEIFAPMLAAPSILLAAFAVSPRHTPWRAAIVFVLLGGGGICVAAASGAAPVLFAGAAAAAQTAWAASARRALVSLFAGAVAGGLLIAYAL